MPIYAYKCSACGHQQDVLQKISDPVLTQCPECGQQTYSKQVTAAGFQLKGSGWYVTDFRNGGKAASGSDSAGAKLDTASAKSDSAPAASSAAPASAPSSAGSDA